MMSSTSPSRPRCAAASSESDGDDRLEERLANLERRAERGETIVIVNRVVGRHRPADSRPRGLVPDVTYLLDTNAWVWAALSDRRLGPKARKALSALDPSERVGLAAISLKEAATVEIAIESELFSPRFPNDPADRLIAATARVHDLTLLTRDRGMRASREIKTLW